MGILGGKRRPACALMAMAAILLLSWQTEAAHAAGAEQMSNPLRADSEGEYIELKKDSVMYEVRRGDCLWDIAEKFLGDGSLYGDIVIHNSGLLSNPDLIYPGMCLAIEESVYVKRQNPRSKVSMWDYEFAMPDGCTTGIMEFGENGGNFCMSGNGVIACLVQDKTEAAVLTTSDWEACTKRLEAYAKEHLQGKTDTFSFEHYQSVKGEDIYLYSCRYRMDFSEYGYQDSTYAYLCCGMKLTKHLQAEFVGFDFGEDIRDSVRYVTASFEEQDDKESYSSVNDSNMAIWEAKEWELKGMFNSMAWVDGCLTYLAEKAVEQPEEKKETMTSKYPK